MNDTSFISALRPGVTLNNGNYTIVDKIGEGGFGITYRAVQNNLNRTVCIKEYFLSGRCLRNTQTNNIGITESSGELYEKYRQGFVREAETVASLSHPNIVEIINIFSENNTSYMVMPFIEGRSLESVVKQQGPLPFADAMNYLAQIAEAVEYIHSRHILHRDIKPSNIMITHDHRAILIDFGSAREFIDDKTQAHTSILTHGYAPPEQYSTVSRKGAFSDVYSLGATFYYALTGRDPVDSAARVTEFMPDPRQLNPAVPEHVNRAVMHAMQLNPSQRPQSVHDFVSELNGASSAAPDMSTQPYHSPNASTASPYPNNTQRSTVSSQGNSRNSKTLLWILLGVGFVAVSVVVGLLLGEDGSVGIEMNDATNDQVSVEQVEPKVVYPDETAVRNTLQRFASAYSENDFATIGRIYAPQVERFHNARNISRGEVVDDCRRYDDTFKVYTKRSEIRWNTFEMYELDNGRVSVTYLEDFYLDREDPSKPTYFLLRKHIILNSDCQIVSIYDDQIEKH